MRQFRSLPVIRDLYAVSDRLKLGYSYLGSPFRSYLRWCFGGGRMTNFDYDLSERNKDHLAGFIAVITCKPHAEVAGYIREIEEDSALRDHIAGQPGGRSAMAGVSDGTRLCALSNLASSSRPGSTRASATVS